MELIEATRIFNLDRQIKFKTSTTEFIIKWGSNYLYKYKNIQRHDIATIKIKLTLQLKEFIGRLNEFKSTTIINEELKENCITTKTKYDIILFWSHFISTHYELAYVVIGMLSICPSEASVERSFSAQNDVHSPDRNNLSEIYIFNEMMIKFNYKKLKSLLYNIIH